MPSKVVTGCQDAQAITGSGWKDLITLRQAPFANRKGSNQGNIMLDQTLKQQLHDYWIDQQRLLQRSRRGRRWVRQYWYSLVCVTNLRLSGAGERLLEALPLRRRSRRGWVLRARSGRPSRGARRGFRRRGRQPARALEAAPEAAVRGAIS